MMTANDTAMIVETMRYATPWDVFMGMTIVTKLCTMIALGAGTVAVIMAIIRRGAGSAKLGLLTALGWIGLGFGVLGGLYTGLNTYIAAEATHTTRFVILLPSIVEGVCAALAGLIVWIIAAMGNAGAKKA